MDKIRLGIIGNYHADYLLKKISRCELAAVCGTNAGPLEKYQPLKIFSDGEPLIAPGEEALNSLELANAMVYSSLLGETVELPMDGASWEKKLNQLIAESKIEKKS